jgi:hypothetical protein
MRACRGLYTCPRVAAVRVSRIGQRAQGKGQSQATSRHPSALSGNWHALVTHFVSSAKSDTKFQGPQQDKDKSSEKREVEFGGWRTHTKKSLWELQARELGEREAVCEVRANRERAVLWRESESSAISPRQRDQQRGLGVGGGDCFFGE